MTRMSKHPLKGLRPSDLRVSKTYPYLSCDHMVTNQRTQYFRTQKFEKTLGFGSEIAWIRTQQIRNSKVPIPCHNPLSVPFYLLLPFYVSFQGNFIGLKNLRAHSASNLSILAVVA